MLGSFVSPWANVNCTVNYFSALSQYSADLFPEHSPLDLPQILADPSTNAAGAVYNDECQRTLSFEYIQYTLHYNASMLHSLPYYQNIMSNAILNTLLGGLSFVNITTISQPIGESKEFDPCQRIQLSKQNLGTSVNIENNLISIIILFLILIGLGVLSASTSAYIFQERELGVKQLQLASGTNPIIYWLSNFIWDFLLHIIAFVVIFTVAAAINWPIFGGNRLGPEVVLVICYSLASVAISYCFTFVFSGSGSGQGAVLGLFIGTGFAFLVVIATTSAIIGGSAEAQKILDYIFRAIW
jgi:NADH:ubiquinone oxidoreductase subunit 3 (subunit A)